MRALKQQQHTVLPAATTYLGNFLVVKLVIQLFQRSLVLCRDEVGQMHRLVARMRRCKFQLVLARVWFRWFCELVCFTARKQNFNLSAHDSVVKTGMHATIDPAKQ